VFLVLCVSDVRRASLFVFRSLLPFPHVFLCLTFVERRCLCRSRGVVLFIPFSDPESGLEELQTNGEEAQEYTDIGSAGVAGVSRKKNGSLRVGRPRNGPTVSYHGVLADIYVKTSEKKSQASRAVRRRSGGFTMVASPVLEMQSLNMYTQKFKYK
jgi:hypothetical protein